MHAPVFSRTQGVQLSLCFGGEGERGAVQGGGRLGQVDHIVADALEIRQGVEQVGHQVAVFGVQGVAGQLDQILVQRALHVVQGLLLLVEQIELLLVVMGQKLHRQMVVAPGQLAHLDHHGPGPLQGH